MEFKVGDKVVLTYRYSGGNASHGTVYTIVRISDSIYDIALYDGGWTYPCYDYEIRLADENLIPTENTSSDEKLCTCNSYNLLHYGCRCGSFKKTETNDEDQKIIDFFFPRSKK